MFGENGENHVDAVAAPLLRPGPGRHAHHPVVRAGCAGRRAPSTRNARPRPGWRPTDSARLHARLDRFVAEGEIAGAISLVARQGKIVDVHTTGMRDREQRLPMTRDTIVRVYSMSKIVTTVAALILVEEGRLRLSDRSRPSCPPSRSRRSSPAAPSSSPQLEAAARPITIRHLLTHTSGFAYGLARSPVDDLYREAQLFQARSGDEFVAKVATLPLIAQPGERFYYGVNTDLLGVIVEKVTGQSLGAFMQARIFDPLGMVDTGFGVPAAKRGAPRPRLPARRHGAPDGRGSAEPDRVRSAADSLSRSRRPPVPLRRWWPVLDGRRLHALRPDAARRRHARRRAHPRPQDGGRR